MWGSSITLAATCLHFQLQAKRVSKVSFFPSSHLHLFRNPSHHSSRTSSCYIAFTPWEASAFYFNLKMLFPTLLFFHKFLMLARLAKYEELCLPKGTMKNWINPSECSHFTTHCTIKTYINIASARIVWQILFKVWMNSNLIFPLALVLDNSCKSKLVLPVPEVR